jgi:hypothetical protein
MFGEARRGVCSSVLFTRPMLFIYLERARTCGARDHRMAMASTGGLDQPRPYCHAKRATER